MKTNLIITTAICIALGASAITQSSLQQPTADASKLYLPITGNRIYNNIDLGKWTLAYSMTNTSWDKNYAQPAGSSIYAVRGDLSASSRLTSLPNYAELQEWSPSGRSLLFWSRSKTFSYNDKIGDISWSVLDATTRAVTTIVTIPISVTTPEINAAPVWVSGSDKLAYFCDAVTFCIRHPNGQIEKRSYSAPVISSTVSLNYRMYISPDAKHIAYDYYDPAYYNSSEKRAFIKNLETNSTYSILPIWYYNDDVVQIIKWSPSGQHFAYIAQTEIDRQMRNIAVFDTNTGALKKILDSDIGTDLLYLGWFPDEQKILYQYQQKGGAPMILASINRDTQPFYFTRHGTSTPQFSPDGKWLAYVHYWAKNEGIWSVIYLRRADDSDERIIWEGYNLRTRIHWSPQPAP